MMILAEESASAKVIENNGESYLYLPPIAQNVVKELIAGISPAMDQRQSDLLFSVIKATPWFQGLNEPRELSLEQDETGTFYFNWAGGKFRISESHSPQWDSFRDRFGHLANFSGIVEQSK